jgi:hypothetical protein
MFGLKDADTTDRLIREEMMLRLSYSDRDRPMLTRNHANSFASVNIALHLPLLAIFLAQHQNDSIKFPMPRPSAEPPLYPSI